ncbi:peptidoglycan-binding protein [Streptomyces olivochromogenes]|uniref:peptidoglycan-binding protein n=1 Tax=Streptomyces olivochromogenes TaxID=1963 RepID=UPI001F16839F|nr:peptidoglycan-binding protein [Streptomyces olivochromogenes]MCF3131867.1 peptidoglycan-binding protein [Streptomyces olivochromogenes]
MKRRTGIVAAGALAAAAVAGVAVVAGGRDAGADADASKDRLPPATATVTRTDLVQSKTVDGRLDYAQRREVKSAVEGTVTRAAEEGRTVRAGQRLYERDARPVVLMYGSTPVFRAMKTGDRGPDVLQLERDLRDLGFGASLYVDTRYDKGTETAVKAWQKSLGIENADGRVGQGDIVFQPGEVRVVSADAALADRIGPDKAVLTVASTKPVVRARLDQGDAVLTSKGTKVEVTLPSGRKVAGKVSGTVRPESSQDASATAQDGITVEITLDGVKSPSSSEDSAATASVTFVSESHKNVLVVPVEAVVALRGENGGYGLQVVEGARTRMVRVETGMTADGRIEVSGSGIAEGMKVGVAAS